MKNDEGRTFCGVAMIQYGLSTDEWEALDPVSDFVNPPYAPPLFIHASALKHSQSREFLSLSPSRGQRSKGLILIGTHR